MNEQVEKKCIFNNGSIWLRADFHLHTKADREFEYIGEEDYYYSRYVDKISEEKINIGVITNHNKFDLVEYEALYKTAKKKDIYLMPGVELSVSDGAKGIHTLVVFDRDSWFKNNSNFIEDFLVSSFEGLDRTDDNSRCKYSIIGLLEKLDEHRRQGRDSFIIFAHVNDSCGFLEEMDGGRIKTTKENELFKKSLSDCEDEEIDTSIIEEINKLTAYKTPEYGSDGFDKMPMAFYDHPSREKKLISYRKKQVLYFANPNLIAQDGCFIMNNSEDMPLAEYFMFKRRETGIKLDRKIHCINIHKSLASYLKDNYLKGIDESTLFPTFKSAAEEINKELGLK